MCLDARRLYGIGPASPTVLRQVGDWRLVADRTGVQAERVAAPGTKPEVWRLSGSFDDAEGAALFLNSQLDDFEPRPPTWLKLKLKDRDRKGLLEADWAVADEARTEIHIRALWNFGFSPQQIANLLNRVPGKFPSRSGAKWSRMMVKEILDQGLNLLGP